MHQRFGCHVALLRREGGPKTRCQLQLFGERQLCKKADAGSQRDASAAALINFCYGLASNERTAERGASSKQCSTAFSNTLLHR